VADHPRIEELKRRVLRDPASLAFAQLAEEYRRAGLLKEAVETCHAGLKHHPTYVSARVTLGRALVELGELDAGQAELKTVLSVAPENLAAIRGLADIHQRRGELPEALDYYRWALEFSRQDPELQQIVRKISGQIVPPEAPAAEARPADAAAAAVPARVGAFPATAAQLPVPGPPPVPAFVAVPVAALGPALPAAASPHAAAEPAIRDTAGRDLGERRIAVLQQWLAAILADRERRQAAG